MCSCTMRLLFSTSYKVLATYAPMPAHDWLKFTKGELRLPSTCLTLNGGESQLTEYVKLFLSRSAW